jgi:hypothetical protein
VTKTAEGTVTKTAEGTVTKTAEGTKSGIKLIEITFLGK